MPFQKSDNATWWSFYLAHKLTATDAIFYGIQLWPFWFWCPQGIFSSPGGTKLSASRRDSACLAPHRWRQVLQCLSCSSDSRSAVKHDSRMGFRQPNQNGDWSRARM